jgi:hypothetical protein
MDQTDCGSLTGLFIYLTTLVSRLWTRSFSAGGIFRSEADKIRRYVDEVKRSIDTRQSDFVTITATLSNIGKFDSFIRKNAKVVVGTTGNNQTAISFIAKLVENESSNKPADDESSKQTPVAAANAPSAYIGLSSRKTLTTKWSAMLSKSDKDRIHGGFMSGLTYLRMGIVANSGDAEVEILSPLTPFSEKAKDIATQRVRDLKVSL